MVFAIEYRGKGEGSLEKRFRVDSLLLARHVSEDRKKSMNMNLLSKHYLHAYNEAKSASLAYDQKN